MNGTGSGKLSTLRALRRPTSRPTSVHDLEDLLHVTGIRQLEVDMAMEQLHRSVQVSLAAELAVVLAGERRNVCVAVIGRFAKKTVDR